MPDNNHMTSNNNDVLVKVEGLSKKFCKELKTSLWYGVKDLVSGVNGSSQERVLRPKEFWAVKDINFELRRGECLGLIGHNGAGKSTLLKILNGLINPDAGKVTIKGRLGALIELGAGFNPILSGRENIYNNGAILGFSRKEINSKLETIIAFAELEEFIDMPVQNYSSGMKVRLGFAVASQMEPDVLIIDEVLAVGDVGFRIKCFNRITELLHRTAVIFVSHSMPQVAKISTVLILMNKGKAINFEKNIGEGIDKYYAEFGGEEYKMTETGLILKSFYVNNEFFSATQTAKIDLKYLDDLVFKFDIEAAILIDKLGIIIRIYDKSLISVATIQNSINKFKKEVMIKVPRLQLGAGVYSIELFFVDYSKLSNEIILGHFINIVEIHVLNSHIVNHSPFQLESEIY